MNSTRLSRRTLLAATLAASAFPSDAIAKAKPPIWVDGLSFLPKDMVDVAASGLRAMICDVSEVEEVKDAEGHPRYLRTFAANDKALDAALARIAATDQIYVAKRGSDIGKGPGCAAFLQFQSCETIGEDLSRIAHFHRKGLRVLQLTHHNNNAFAGGAIEPVQSGLTSLGREGIDEMNRVGILPDVSHGSSATIIEAAKHSKTPIVFSHGACKAIINHARCIDDAGIRAIASRGGVVGIFMMSFWLTRDPVPKVEHLVAQLRHVANIGGVEAVSIANDYPMSGQENLVKLHNDNREGVKEYLDWWQAMRERKVQGFAEYTPEHVVIPELNNIHRMQRIAEALQQYGFKARAVDKIMGKNWKRVLTDVLG
jgi:microsomal dipeptidase-like Zn-dependent dipeptidase